MAPILSVLALFLATAQAALHRPMPRALNGTGSPLTTVVTAFTTVCPSPTILTYGSNTYTITAATTLTITDCPCTLTKSTTSACASAKTVTLPKIIPSIQPFSTGQGCTTSCKGPSIVPATTTVAGVGTPATVTAASTAARYSGAGEKLGSQAALLMGALGLLVL